MRPSEASLMVEPHGLVVRQYGQGFPLLMLHGHSLDGRMWGPQLETLGQHFHLIIPDLPGYGGSAKPGQPFSYTEVLLKLLDWLEIGQAHLLGLSLGGNIALELALNHPERVNRLVVAGSSLKGFPLEQGYAASLQSIVVCAQQQGLDVARALWLTHPLFASLKRQPTLKQLLTDWVSDYSGWHWLEDRSPSEGLEDISQKLAGLNSPTLVLLGQHDIERNQLIAQKLAREIPQARLQTINQAGHMTNLEATQLFNQVTLPFLQEGV